MKTYRGPAILSLPTGDISVTADLILDKRGPNEPGVSSWWGQLLTDSDVDPFFTFFDSGAATLRIGDRKGTVLPRRYSPPSRCIEVSGSGPAPFD